MTARPAIGWLAVLLLALLGLTVWKAMRREPEAARRTATAAEKEEVRRMWDTYERAGQRRMEGRLEEAAALYRQVLEIRPEHEDALYYLGNCYLDLGRAVEAQATYSRLVALNPEGSSRGYMQLGLLYASGTPGVPRNLELAQSCFQRALAMDTDSGALLALGEVALLAGRWAEARRILEQEAAGNQMSLAAPYLLGYLDWRDGNAESAWRRFRVAVERNAAAAPKRSFSEEGDLRSGEDLRRLALVRQSVFGAYWSRLASEIPPLATAAAMEHEYERLEQALRVDKL